jgi:hypothetical protein
MTSTSLIPPLEMERIEKEAEAEMIKIFINSPAFSSDAISWKLGYIAGRKEERDTAIRFAMYIFKYPYEGLTYDELWESFCKNPGVWGKQSKI